MSVCGINSLFIGSQFPNSSVMKRNVCCLLTNIYTDNMKIRANYIDTTIIYYDDTHHVHDAKQHRLCIALNAQQLFKSFIHYDYCCHLLPSLKHFCTCILALRFRFAFSLSLSISLLLCGTYTDSSM